MSPGSGTRMVSRESWSVKTRFALAKEVSFASPEEEAMVLSNPGYCMICNGRKDADNTEDFDALLFESREDDFHRWPNF
jgi:hypothetical protein